MSGVASACWNACGARANCPLPGARRYLLHKAQNAVLAGQGHRATRTIVLDPAGMRERLSEIHGQSASPLARDLAGTLMGLVDETFSGVYANANQAATRFVDEEIREDPGIYPPRELRARLVTTESPPAETQRLRTRAWTRATTGR